MIQVENLTRCYGELTAVDGVSFNVERGEVVGLLGHNGAGKTTIMKMLTGYLEPSAGYIGIGELEMGQDTRQIQARIGYLPENCPVWPEMPVIDFLDYQAMLHGVPNGKRTEAVARAIRRTSLQEKAGASIQTLSRGYQQRVGVAQALLHQPDIFILDEPTNGLDPTQIRHMRDLIRDLARTATVIVSTHILQEVQATCERVLIMRTGRLVVDSKLEALEHTDGLHLEVEGDPRAVLKHFTAPDEVVEQKSRGTIRRFHIRGASDQAPELASALARANLRIHALEPQRRDLERLFAEVNEEMAHA